MTKEELKKLYVEYISIKNKIRSEFLSFYEEAEKTIFFNKPDSEFVAISVTDPNGFSRLYKISYIRYDKTQEDVIVCSEDGSVFYMDDIDAVSMCYLMECSLPLL